MSLENERTYTLLRRSNKVCRRCALFQSYDCPNGPNENDPDYKCFTWSSMSACPSWTPNEQADEALQELTMRKLKGQNIEKSEPKCTADIGEFFVQPHLGAKNV